MENSFFDKHIQSVEQKCSQISEFEQIGKIDSFSLDNISASFPIKPKSEYVRLASESSGNNAEVSDAKVVAKTENSSVFASLKQLPADKSKLQVKTQYKQRTCLLYTSPSPRDATLSRMPSSA